MITARLILINRKIRKVSNRVCMLTAWLHAGIRGDITAVCCGLLLVLAFAPFGCYPLAILMPACLFWLIENVNLRRAARRGFLFAFAEFLFGVYWIYNSIHVIADAPVWVALLMLVGLSAVMGIYLALTCVLSLWLTPGSGVVRWLCALPAVWTLFEWVRSWFLSGFPWLSLGYSQIGSALRGYAPVMGVFGVSLTAVFSAGLLLCICVRSLRITPRLICLGVLVAIWGLGGVLSTVQFTQAAGPAITVSLVQGDIPQTTKWAPETFEPTMQLYRRLTEAHWTSQLIIWPEAAVPDYYDDVKESYLDPLEQEARIHGTDMLVGVPTEDIANGHYYNSVISMGKHDGVYNKRHLVPFGEFFPVPEWVRRWLELMDLPYSDFTRGAADQPLLQVAGYPVGVSICYEDAFSSEIIRTLPQAAFLVNVSNDGWFGDSIALPQHLEIARMRALEAGRYLLRDTNTGITAVIDPRGMTTSRIPVDQPGVLTAEIAPYAGSTLYVRVGIRLIMCLIVVLLFVTGIQRLLVFKRN
ncbi:MAG: apolipoprotein N-acyltransferase [Gammaproteobacteria bacterium]